VECNTVDDDVIAGLTCGVTWYTERWILGNSDYAESAALSYVITTNRGVLNRVTDIEITINVFRYVR